MQNDKYVLGLLCMEDEYGNKSIQGQTWIQKMLYVASKDHPELDYEFKPFRYGMYSNKVKNVLTNLNKKGLVCIDDTDENNIAIHPTAEGLEEYRKIAKHIKPEIYETLYDIKRTLNRLRYNELIVLLYTQYPEMLEASELKDKCDKWRENAALSMAYDNRVSFGLGVEMSGLDRDEFEEKLSKNGVDPIK